MSDSEDDFDVSVNTQDVEFDFDDEQDAVVAPTPPTANSAETALNAARSDKQTPATNTPLPFPLSTRASPLETSAPTSAAVASVAVVADADAAAADTVAVEATPVDTAATAAAKAAAAKAERWKGFIIDVPPVYHQKHDWTPRNPAASCWWHANAKADVASSTSKAASAVNDENSDTNVADTDTDAAARSSWEAKCAAQNSLIAQQTAAAQSLLNATKQQRTRMDVVAAAETLRREAASSQRAAAAVAAARRSVDENARAAATTAATTAAVAAAADTATLNARIKATAAAVYGNGNSGVSVSDNSGNSGRNGNGGVGGIANGVVDAGERRRRRELHQLKQALRDNQQRITRKRQLDNARLHRLEISIDRRAAEVAATAKARIQATTALVGAGNDSDDNDVNNDNYYNIYGDGGGSGGDGGIGDSNNIDCGVGNPLGIEPSPPWGDAAVQQLLRRYRRNNNKDGGSDDDDENERDGSGDTSGKDDDGDGGDDDDGWTRGADAAIRFFERRRTRPSPTVRALANVMDPRGVATRAALRDADAAVLAAALAAGYECAAAHSHTQQRVFSAAAYVRDQVAREGADIQRECLAYAYLQVTREDEERLALRQTCVGGGGGNVKAAVHVVTN
jgi:hypothetical protein